MRLLFHRAEVEDAMRDAVQQMKSALRPLRIQRLISYLGYVWKLVLGEPEDALGVVGARDLLGHPGLVVADIGPAEAVLEHAILEQLAGIIEGVGGLVR